MQLSPNFFDKKGLKSVFPGCLESSHFLDNHVDFNCIERPQNSFPILKGELQKYVLRYVKYMMLALLTCSLSYNQELLYALIATILLHHYRIVALNWKKVVFLSPCLIHSTLDFWYHKSLPSLTPLQPSSLQRLASSLIDPLSTCSKRIFFIPEKRDVRLLFCLKMLSKTSLFHDCNYVDRLAKVVVKGIFLSLFP